MKRVLTTVTASITAVLALAGPALAQQYPPYPPQPGGDAGTTGGAAVGGGGDLAFTGTNVTVWLIVAALAIVVGVVIVLLSRRPTSVEAK